VTRRKRLSETASADAKSHRGNNWNEDDSVLIVKAYRYAEEKKCDWESKDIYHKRMFEHFQSLNPSVKTRTVKSVQTQWGEMEGKYKFVSSLHYELICRLIVGFNAHRVPGSTGRPGWFTLSKSEQAEFLATKSKNQRRVLFLFLK
jgi:hypothetical protein